MTITYLKKATRTAETGQTDVRAAVETLLARIDEWMATTELTDSVRRMVSERRDDVERALRCQEAAD